VADGQMTASAPLTIYPALRNHRIPQKKRNWLYGSSRKVAGQAVYGGSLHHGELKIDEVNNEFELAS